MALDDLPVRVESWTGDVPDRQAQVKKRSADFGGVQLAPHHFTRVRGNLERCSPHL